MEFYFAGTGDDVRAERLLAGLQPVLERHGHRRVDTSEAASLVFHPFPAKHPRSFRRQNSGMFLVGITTLGGFDDPIAALYPRLVRSLSNLVVSLTPEGKHDIGDVHLVTLEQGHVRLPAHGLSDAFYEEFYRRLEPLATSRLVVNNIFEPDLEPELWAGDERTRGIGQAGRFLAELDLLPAVFPIEDVLSPRELRQLKKLYGIGGLSYGNFSARLDDRRFWMSASGVDKSRLEIIGRDILLVKGYDADRNAILLSVPPNVEPRRVSVDAIEHWMIYRENPGVRAILHVHAWTDGIRSTEVTYPCGTYEMGRAVADLIRTSPDPVHSIIGLKNHGVTVTGDSMEEILARVTGRLTRSVPMT
ncbi:MAG: class II aldolase/adducin family protein [Gemmatimonadetes bacterium]|nr:class II aldolase/adducin family protein [Gemmatimonadota bacterium]